MSYDLLSGGKIVATIYDERSAHLLEAAPELRDLLDEALHEFCSGCDVGPEPGAAFGCKHCTPWARRTIEVLKKAGESS